MAVWNQPSLWYPNAVVIIAVIVTAGLAVDLSPPPAGVVKITSVSWTTAWNNSSSAAAAHGWILPTILPGSSCLNVSGDYVPGANFTCSIGLFPYQQQPNGSSIPGLVLPAFTSLSSPFRVLGYPLYLTYTLYPTTRYGIDIQVPTTSGSYALNGKIYFTVRLL